MIDDLPRFRTSPVPSVLFLIFPEVQLCLKMYITLLLRHDDVIPSSLRSISSFNALIFLFTVSIALRSEEFEEINEIIKKPDGIRIFK